MGRFFLFLQEMKNELRIVFMGTPAFAIPGLEILIQSGYDVAGVVTAPDKPAGRGQVIKFSPVKDFAIKQNLKILQPISLKSPEFITELKGLNANLFIVVAFRMLPEVVWKMPLLGTFNLHASLLPNYRGAAPINHAIINGEKETGVTTFFIDQKIDTGKIIFTEKLTIGDDETAGELHDRLMITGGNLVLKTVQAIGNGTCQPVSQDIIIDTNIQFKQAPKIFKEDCRIDWSCKSTEIYNLVRGLSPYPTAFSQLQSTGGETFFVKIFKLSPVSRPEPLINADNILPGAILTDNRNYLYVAGGDGNLSIEEMQIEGKRRMKVQEFLRGFVFDEGQWKFE